MASRENLYEARLKRARDAKKKQQEKNNVKIVPPSGNKLEQYKITAKSSNNSKKVENIPNKKKCYSLEIKWRQSDKTIAKLKWCA